MVRDKVREIAGRASWFWLIKNFLLLNYTSWDWPSDKDDVDICLMLDGLVDRMNLSVFALSF